MAIYNISNITSAGTIPGIAEGLNVQMGGMLGAMFLLSLWVILYTVASRRGDFIVSFTTASYITSVVGFLGMAAGIVTANYALIPVSMFVAATAILIINRD